MHRAASTSGGRGKTFLHVMALRQRGSTPLLLAVEQSGSRGLPSGGLSAQARACDQEGATGRAGVTRAIDAAIDARARCMQEWPSAPERRKDRAELLMVPASSSQTYTANEPGARHQVNVGIVVSMCAGLLAAWLSRREGPDRRHR
jgi:hypothetical protein